MKTIITTTLAATMLAITLSASAAVKSHGNAIVVEQPSDLPEAAQNATNSMYLHETGAGEVVLYLEQRDGKRLAVLDVTDPAQIKTVSDVALNAPAPFDFIQDLGDSAVLVRYRDNSGVAVLNFRHYKRPVLSAAPALTDVTNYEPLGETGMLVQITGTAANAMSQPEGRTASYRIIDTSTKAGPTVLATTKDVRERLYRQETGTYFLLNEQGVTVVRQPQVESEYATEEIEMNHN